MSTVFTAEQLLKGDLFGRVERGTWTGAGAAPMAAVRRDVRGVPWWMRPLAGFALAQEARALRRLAAVRGVPRLLARGRGHLVRSFIDGEPLPVAAPTDPRWFTAAVDLVADLHAAGVTHNDLHKEANWIVRRDGGVAIVDFQVATSLRWPRWLRRLLEREDVRHALKHKRRYCEGSMTDAERRAVARSAWTSRLWARTGKRCYNLVTRRLLRWADREGAD